MQAVTALAQTGIEDEKRYHSQLKRYQSQMNTNFQKYSEEVSEERASIFQQGLPKEPYARRDRLIKIVEYRMNLSKNLLLEPPLNFTFQRLSFSETLARMWLDLCLLVLWIGVGLALALVALARCEVRP